MMREGFDFAEDLGFAVQAVEDELLESFKLIEPNLKKFNYIYGRPAEVNKEIQQMSEGTNSRFEKHPLIALFEPINIIHPKDGSYPFASNVEIIIAMPSTLEWTSYERQQKNVKPFLMPIYERFMHHLSKRQSIIAPNPKKDLAHTKTVIKGGKLFNDLIDCIEIKDLTIKFSFTN